MSEQMHVQQHTSQGRLRRSNGPAFKLDLQPRKLPPVPMLQQGSIPRIDTWDASEIVPGYLYLGSGSDARHETSLRSKKIEKVLNVSDECAVPIELYEQLGIEWQCLKIRDNSDANIEAIIPEAILFIAESILLKEPILVHCRMGVSRSASVVIAYIMEYGNTSLVGEKQFCYNHAFRTIKSCRDRISPNFGFCIALRTHGKKLGFPSSNPWDKSSNDATPVQSPLTPLVSPNSAFPICLPVVVIKKLD